MPHYIFTCHYAIVEVPMICICLKIGLSCLLLSIPNQIRQ